MSERIGIIQGRLSPPLGESLQAFPVDTWEEEFPKVNSCGFDAMEWIFEVGGYRGNPIWTEEGIQRIRELSHQYGVDVPSICADYFMKRPLFRVSVQEKKEAVRTLKRLIRQGALLRIQRILLPVLEEAEIRTEEEFRELVISMKECFVVAEDFGIELAIESNLESERYISLMKELDHPLAKIYYDVGNRVAMGYDIQKDVRQLGRWISGVHIKDRKRSGPSVPFGEGDVDFPGFFRALREINFQGFYILQGARKGNEVETAKRYLEFVRGHLKEKRHEEHSYGIR